MKSVLSVGNKSMNEDTSMPRNPEIPTVNVDDNGRLTSDVICPSCHYNLRGIQQNGACPECGFSVEKAILTIDTPRWTRLQVVLCTLAIAYGFVFPIVNYVAFQYEYNISTMLAPELVFIVFVVVWILGGLACFIMLLIAASNEMFTLTCVLIIVAVLIETIIALASIALWWARYTSV